MIFGPDDDPRWVRGEKLRQEVIRAARELVTYFRAKRPDGTSLQRIQRLDCAVRALEEHEEAL